MAFPFKLNDKEIEAMKELESRIKSELSPCLKEDETLYYRFLKARDFDVDKAETMLRQNIAWRKAFQVDTILETFQPEEVFTKYIGSCLLGPDKEGNLIRYGPTGKTDPRDVASSMKMNDYMKHFIYLAEYDINYGVLESKKTGTYGYQEIFILDLDGLTFASATSKLGADLFLRMTHLLQDNYPERMKSLFIINAPVFYSIVFLIVKRVMSSEMIKKIHVFGQDGWKEALLEIIDADVLPAFMGGKRTDPDGDPACRTFVMQGGRVPPKYFLSDEERYFKDTDQVNSIIVSPGSDYKFFVKVKEYHSVIEWKFETKSKDIGFGLFYQMSNEDLEIVLPVQRFTTNDGTETGSYKCKSTGTYVIIFDNSHSWFNSKEVFYCVAVHEPDTN